MPSSHSPSGLAVAFDDDHAVANAGLLLPATLAERLGIEQAVDRLVDLGDRPGHHRPGRKVLTLVHAMVAGGDCIDDADVLRTGQTAAVLGHRVMAPSTLGTFLRSFTFLIRVGDIEPAFVCAHEHQRCAGRSVPVPANGRRRA